MERWQRRDWPRPDILVVSGSGLGVSLGEPVAGALALEEILPFPVHPVEGHPHRVELLRPGSGRHALYQRGRLHAYQGYSAAETVFVVRLAALLGARTLLLTNSAGGIHPDQRAGELAVIRDHLNLTGLNPLRGSLPPTWGPRFPDLTEAYDRRLAELAHRHAGELGIPLGEVVYAGVAGPSYETPAEVRMLRALGADAVGMSTVLEVIAARHLGMRCLGFSLVANLAAGVAPRPLDHREVLAAGEAAAGRIQALLGALLAAPELVEA